MLRKLLIALAASPFVVSLATVLGSDTWTWGT
ncbi:hypothetical protein Intca_2526 [Intrasporangium calvum DSM 43043]|uniref:Uncharacterized protein n=1 Tax=Intrasporangium calvum (strain ATCC 23552 / DSM 43043 / JCM 3097 / NBRC 12989 / NCIMB 10167 / NRRL B-3866 / 7 KIP) TaxID=710696 RepID=E6S798_INTC7|nr:hypothetical protein Intca_2526 [Intrasporangium calvum DSM 43043]